MMISIGMKRKKMHCYVQWVGHQVSRKREKGEEKAENAGEEYRERLYIFSAIKLHKIVLV